MQITKNAVHLLTREALQLYLSKMTREGIMVFHISSRYLDVEPVLGSLTERLALQAFIQHDAVVNEQDKKEGKNPSTYVVTARRLQDLRGIQADPRWRRLRTDQKMPVWTDDYSSVLSILRIHPALPAFFDTSAPANKKQIPQPEF